MLPASVFERHPEAMTAMERHGMIYKNGRSFALSSLATVSVTVLGSPKGIEIATDGSLTAYEARRQLQENGWETCESPLNCSVQQMRIMKYQCKEYFSLMIEHSSQVLFLTNERSFSHAQKHYYYKTIQTVCGADPFAPLLNVFFVEGHSTETHGLWIILI